MTLLNIQGKHILLASRSSELALIRPIMRDEDISTGFRRCPLTSLKASRDGLGGTVVKDDVVSLLHAVGRDLFALGHAVVGAY